MLAFYSQVLYSQQIEAIYLVFEKRGRDRLGILAEILEVAMDGCLKTQIMYRANLSFRQLKEYLSLMLDLRLIESPEANGKMIYRTTVKGLRVLQAYQEIRSLIKKAESADETIEVKVGKK